MWPSVSPWTQVEIKVEVGSPKVKSRPVSGRETKSPAGGVKPSPYAASPSKVEADVKVVSRPGSGRKSEGKAAAAVAAGAYTRPLLSST